MAEGQVADAALKEGVQQEEVPAEGVAVLHAQEERPLPGRVETPGIPGRQGPLAELGMLGEGGVQGVEQPLRLESGGREPRLGAGSLGYEHGHEGGGQAAFPHAYQIQVAAQQGAAPVPDAQVPAFQGHHARGVAVGVHREQRAMEFLGLREPNG